MLDGGASFCRRFSRRENARSLRILHMHCRSASWRNASRRQPGAQSRGDARGRADRETSRSRRRRARPRRRAGRAHGTRAGRRPCRRRECSRARRHAATCASATARIAGPESPPVPPPSHGRRSPPRRGDSAIARSVLISDTASAPASCAAAAQAGTSAVFGVSLTISGLRVRAATGATTCSSWLRVGADIQAGLDVRAGDVQLDRGDLRARVARAHQRAELLGASSPSRS